MKHELVTTAIVCYKNFDLIYDAMRSIFAQDYPAIELVVSDDGSAHFPHDQIKQFILDNKGPNIVRYLINHEPVNLGTVRHINHVVERSTGAYLMVLAADDALYDTTVVSRFVDAFFRVDSDCYIMMAQTGMYDETLARLDYYYLRPYARTLLERGYCDDALNYFLQIIHGLPTTSTFCKRAFFDKYGPFDTQYTLVEDIPMHFRLAELGAKIHYENFVAVKHRHGGISHSEDALLSQAKIQYFQDIIDIRKNSYAAAQDSLPSPMKKLIAGRNRLERLDMEFQIAQSAGFGQRLLFFVRCPFYALFRLQKPEENRASLQKARIFFTVLLLLSAVSQYFAAAGFLPAGMMLFANWLSLTAAIAAGINLLVWGVLYLMKILIALYSFPEI